ncbi:hypothetical protein DEU56DRAFT_907328 [Suillus clintonianus]|uniref:uncharacterized protein n=1 Tax=Suillus clintonianus TaxID=1904413 RepID=UPI001B865166|nr:uncharacterized protein DEU56DRAFT_907328 [Suillus clintonianus]KAG2153848.1 hypothetical protein DEU56DRAFT_907328 [Suillus clintonianus]
MSDEYRGSGRVDEQTSGRADEWTSRRVDEQTSGRVDERTSGRADEWMSRRVDEQTSGRADEWTSRRVDEQTSGRADKRMSGQADDMSGIRRIGRPTKRRSERTPFTPDIIISIHNKLNLEDPKDAAIFACITTSFYSIARLGEFTVSAVKDFDSHRHVTRGDVSEGTDRNGLAITKFHIPSTKSSPKEGEDAYWAEQQGLSDPKAALENHFHINQGEKSDHLSVGDPQGKAYALCPKPSSSSAYPVFQPYQVSPTSKAIASTLASSQWDAGPVTHSRATYENTPESLRHTSKRTPPSRRSPASRCPQ